MNFLTPQGIGDTVWTLLKMEDAARKLGASSIHVKIACLDDKNQSEARSLEFVRRFSFIDSAEMYKITLVEGQQGPMLLPGPASDAQGYFRYLPDGRCDLPGIDYVLMPNAALERGIRLENWLPQFSMNWRAVDSFTFRPEEEMMAEGLGKDFVVFFTGTKDSNGLYGHNRNGLWKPHDWVELARRLRRRLKCRIMVVGTESERSYYEEEIKPISDLPWEDHIGFWGVGQTYAALKRARFIIAYQSGIGIVPNYFGIPVGIFWRAKGDSISPHFYASFEESMASAWADPKMIAEGKHLPLIYGRHDVDYVMAEVERRGW
jgi:hypothetical protein